MTTTLSPRLALLALMTLPLAACEGMSLPNVGPQEPAVPAHQGPPTVSPVEVPIETGTGEVRPVATAEPLTHSTAAFSARGNEPFWSVDVAGNTAIYKTPDNQRGRAVRVDRLTFAEGVEYIGVVNGRPFAINIRATACQDTMADQSFPMTARLTISGRTERGCAQPASPEVAQAVAATRAPAPAAPRTTAQRPASTRPAANPQATETPAETAQPVTPATQAPASQATAAPGTETPGAETPAASTPQPAPAASTPAEAPVETPSAPAESVTAPQEAAPANLPAPTTESPAAPNAETQAAPEASATVPPAATGGEDASADQD